MAELIDTTWSATMSPSPAEVQAGIDQLRKYHQVGTEILARYGRRAKPAAQTEPGVDAEPDKNTMAGICERYRLPTHVVRVLRRFADDEQGYTDSDLDELCAQCEESNRVVTLTQVSYLVTICDREKRRQFQRMMIRKGWKGSRTVAERIRQFGRHRKGGRKAYIPEDRAGVLLQIQNTTTVWRRWFRRLSDEDDPTLQVRLSDLQPELQDALRKVEKAMGSLDAKLPKPKKKGRWDGLGDGG
ncbi:MAG: hypothetical protein NTY19_07200 [Planctomycetota bacterium]|nr:hypothetical protein [Planctomycetota bacterium]